MTEQNEDQIPLFKKWSHWYVLVIAFLALLIILFSLFTKYFA
jgi:hypothetical protein